MLTLATTLNTLNVAFADYNVHSVSYNSETISGGGTGAISDVIMDDGNSVVNDVGQVVFNSRYFRASDTKVIGLDTRSIASDAGAANKDFLPKISSATAQPDAAQEVGIYIRVYNSITSDNISYYHLVDNTYNTEVPGYSGQWWTKYAVKWLADTNEFEIQQIPGKAENYSGGGIKMIDFLNNYVYGKDNMYAIITNKSSFEFGSNDSLSNYFKAGVKLKWEQESGYAPNQLTAGVVYPEGANKVIVRGTQPTTANFTYAKVIGSYGSSSTGDPVAPLYRIYPEFPTDNGDYILKLNHSIATTGGGEKLTWETYSPVSGFEPQGTVANNGQILIGNTDGTYTWSTQTITSLATKEYVDEQIQAKLNGSY